MNLQWDLIFFTTISFILLGHTVAPGIQRLSDNSGIATNFEFTDNELIVEHMGDEMISIDAIHPQDINEDNKTDFFLSLTTRQYPQNVPHSGDVCLEMKDRQFLSIYDLGEFNDLQFPFVLGDIDGDGDEDLVRCQLGETGSDLVWIENQNTLRPEYLVGCRNLVMGHLNEDDILDILCVRSSRIYLFNFNSDGSLTQVFSQSYYWSVVSPVYFDADGDGLLDIVFIGIYTFSCCSDYLYWIKQLPNFQFSSFEKLYPGDFLTLITLDINGDGRLDLFTQERERILDGTQVVKEYRNYIWYEVVNQRLTPHSRISHSSYIYSRPQFGDVNGDGQPDLISWCTHCDWYQWYEQIDSTLFIPQLLHCSDLRAISFFTFGNRDQNSARGILLATSKSVYLDNYDNLTNSLVRETIFPSLKNIIDISGIDVNGDGLEDIVMTIQGDVPLWFEQQSNQRSFVKRTISLFRGSGGVIVSSPNIKPWAISFSSDSVFLFSFQKFLDSSNYKIIDRGISNQTNQLALVDIDQDDDQDLFVMIGDQLFWYKNNFPNFTFQGKIIAANPNNLTLSNQLHVVFNLQSAVVTLMDSTDISFVLGWCHTYDKNSSRIVSRPICPFENITFIVSAQVRKQTSGEDLIIHLRDADGIESLVICDLQTNLTSLVIPISGMLSSFYLCDLDGDKLLDVVTMPVTMSTKKNPLKYSVHWYQQLEASTFYEHPRMVTSGDTNLPLLSCADVDGDERADILLASTSIAWMKLEQKCFQGTRYDPKENVCVDCPNKQNCPDGATCSSHRRGRGCDLCMKGYFNFNGICTKCSDVSAGLSFTVGLFATIALIFLASAAANNYMEHEGRQHLLAIAGITITHFQTLGLFFSYDFHIPFTFLKITSWFESVFTFMFFRFLFSPECHDGWNFYERWSFNVFAPFLLIIIQFLIVILLEILSPKISKSLQPGKISISIIIYTFIYTLQNLWEMWDCVHRGDGTYGLEDHVNIQCFRNGKWAGFATLAFFLTLFYFAFVLYSTTHADSEVVIFITEKYKDDHKNWEFIVELPKKAIFVFIQTFSFGQVGQFVMSIIALMIFWILHARAMPFQDNYPSHLYPNLENDYQQVAYLLQLITLILLITFGGNQNQTKDDLSATVAYSISYFLSVFVALLFSYHRLRRKIPKIVPSS
jgi:hypothetical protein